MYVTNSPSNANLACDAPILYILPALIGELSQRHDVFISVKPKKGQLQSVIIKSIEQNIQWIYDARFKMLACSYQPGQQATPNITPTTDAQREYL